jgi:hypothetical protein
MELADFHQREWDYLIIGTGMGGATLGYALNWQRCVDSEPQLAE